MFSLRNISLLGLYGTAIAAFFYFDLQQFFTYDALQTYRFQLLDWVKTYPYLSVAVYVLIYALIVALSVPGGAMMTLLTVFAATLGATALFFLAQTTLGKPLQDKAGPWLKKMSEGFQDNAFSYLLTLRLVPVFPFFVVNLVPAFLGVKTRTYILATFIGIIPGTYVFSSVGSGIGKIFESGEDFNVSSVFSTDIIIGLVGLGLLSLLPVVYKKFKGKKD